MVYASDLSLYEGIPYRKIGTILPDGVSYIHTIYPAQQEKGFQCPYCDTVYDIRPEACKNCGAQRFKEVKICEEII